MWAHWNRQQRIGAFMMGALALIGMAAVGRSHYGQNATLTIEPLPDPVVKTSPATNQTFSALTAPTEVVVHVVGAVNKPGLFHMRPDSRVSDAIEKAGGAKGDADLERINLAARLIDGSQVKVPAKGAPIEEASTETTYQTGETGSAEYVAPSATRSPSKPASSGIVRLNTASKSQLESLPGIGPATAQKILQYRQEHGGFGSIEELLSVKGIGPKKLDAIRRHVRL